MESWTKALTFLADTFIPTETELIMKLAARAGFDGMIDMTIACKNDEGLIGFVPFDFGVPSYSRCQFSTIVIGALVTSVRRRKANGNDYKDP